MPALTTYKRGEVVWTYYPFVESHEGKDRPALIISSNQFNANHQTCILLMITGSISPHPFPDEIVLTGQVATEAGLDKDSTVRTSVLFTVAKNRIRRKGRPLPQKLVEQALEKVRGIFI